ncbi:MAG TPA: glycosyltransferase family 9 protein, partial [Steroidobacteraceae bacterium]|nr:glycosyltransferase family 9 protein [Steroidobacteraceae bacterium]
MLAFRTTPDTIPASTPYIHAAPEAVTAWAARLGPHARPRVGLVWSGRRYAPINYPRDVPLSSLEPLLALDARFFCLQTELADADRSCLQRYPNLVDSSPYLEDFAETAALIENLDLVIAVDTAVAHLAGALGKPIWLLNRYAACWRWQPARGSSPWYPTLQEFRQDRVGDWSTPIERAREALRTFLASPPTEPVQLPPPTVHTRPTPDPIRLVCATRLSREEFFAKAALGRSIPVYRGFPRDQNIELRLFADNRQGLPALYNTAIEEARNRPALLVFLHDDVFLSDYYWAHHLHAGLERFRIVGLAGNRRRVRGQASWMYVDGQFTRDDDDHLSGVIGHGDPFPDLRQLSVYGEPGQEVKLLDGVLIAAYSRTLIEHDLRFDPRFRFDFYDLDFCRQAELHGLSMGTWPMSIVHASAGKLGGEAWQEAYRTYLDKYREL